MGAQRPFGAAKCIERRCSEANRRRCARMNSGAKEPRALASGPNVGAQTFGSFGAFAKGTRCKSETASGNARRNGYAPSQPEHGRLSGRHREQAHSYRKTNRRQQKTRRQSLIYGFPVSAAKKIRNLPAATPHKPVSHTGDSASTPPQRQRSTHPPPPAQPSIPQPAQPAPPRQ